MKEIEAEMDMVSKSRLRVKDHNGHVVHEMTLYFNFTIEVLPDEDG